MAKGFLQKEGIDYLETYSFVANINIMRVLLTMANQQNLHFHQMDVITTFVNSKLNEEIGGIHRRKSKT